MISTVYAHVVSKASCQGHDKNVITATLICMVSHAGHSLSINICLPVSQPPYPGESPVIFG